MEGSPISYRKWVFAIYLETTSLKGVSSMKLHRDIGVSQPTAWFMLHRIREAWAIETEQFSGPVEVYETYMGGKNANKHQNKKIKNANGTVGKTAVVGLKDRKTNQVQAKVVERTNQETLQGFVNARKTQDAKVYTDEHGGYMGLDNHEVVKHSVGEYVREQVHTNGIESFWSMLKRAHKGVYHKMSVKHLHRYVNEFAGRHNIREQGTLDQMVSVVAGMIGKRLMYKNLIA